MTKYFSLWICFILAFNETYSQYSPPSETKGVEVTIKRATGIYGTAVKWPISVVKDVDMRQLGVLKQGKPIMRNMIGKIDKMEYITVNIPSQKETYIAVGSHYFYIKADPGSKIEINVAGLDYQVSSCEGNAKVSAGFKSPDIALYDNWYEELELSPEENCQLEGIDLEGYEQMSLK